MGLRSPVLSFGILLCAIAACSVARAQGTVDPGLPEAPLPHGHVFFVMPAYQVVDPDERVPPLRMSQKYEMAYRKLVSPNFAVMPAISSAYDTATGFGPKYPRAWGSFWSRYGYNAGNEASQTFFTYGLMPALLHQDPRYFRKGSGSIKSRVLWVLRADVMTVNDDGMTTVNTSGLTGVALSTALTNAYAPASSRTVGDNLEHFAISEAFNALWNGFLEFGGGWRRGRSK